jgi:hypothetical protein
MGECNLDKIEYTELHGENFPDMAQDGEGKVLSRWEILARNADLPWRSEIPCTGENGNDITSSRRRMEHIESEPKSKRLLNRFLKYYELLGKLEAS